MSLQEPTDVIEPRDGPGYEPADYLREMFNGAYTYGSVLKYHGLRLKCKQSDGRPRVWTVYSADGKFVETLNLEAVRTTSELAGKLAELAAGDPTGTGDD